ncbi:MAG: right-handed parallel beta-helix repeat-containing protein [Anaerolineaceae bacterium]|nr:right-handed parallel beta-helix repeat-containing protein [Anaerolineaceae bacterium]
MDKYTIAPPAGSTNNGLGAEDRPWKEGHFEKLVADDVMAKGPVVDVRAFGAKGDGVTDDTAAIQAAIDSNNVVIIPNGEYKITDYIMLPSNITLLVLGKINCYNCRAGLVCANSSNVTIDGMGQGYLWDSIIKENYEWNTAIDGLTTLINIRQSRNIVVKNITIEWFTYGVMVSNWTQNRYQTGQPELSGTSENIILDNIKATHGCLSAITAYNGINITMTNNYIYRCGDGGIWMMGCSDSCISNNYRITDDNGGSLYPNDQQGICAEACTRLSIDDNIVCGFSSYGIDVKNSCKYVNIRYNKVTRCQTGIVTREGDAVDNPCYNITIKGNTIDNSGTHHTLFGGAIEIEESFNVSIEGNEIGKISTFPAINCKCNKFLVMNFPQNPSVNTLVIKDNVFRFLYGTDTNNAPSCIRINGEYVNVYVDGNVIDATRFFTVDTADTISPAIEINYTQISVQPVNIPVKVKISNNDILAWAGNGIKVVGGEDYYGQNLLLTENTITYCRGIGIVIDKINRVIINGNDIHGNGSESSNVKISQSNNLRICANNLFQRDMGGVSGTTYSIELDTVDNAVITNNILGAAWGTVSQNNCTNITIYNN